MSSFWSRLLARGSDGEVQLTGLSDHELQGRYGAVDMSITTAGNPEAVAAHADALAAEILRRHPDSASFWYDRGMFAKWREDWTASMEYNQRALDLLDDAGRHEQPAAWNLGIAATALRDWPVARLAWGAYGLHLPPRASPGDPIEADFGQAPVRLNAAPRFIGQQQLTLDDRAWNVEVVWGRRLCPARIQIKNVPTPESGHRFADIVIHDGDPVGTRRIDDRDLGVFNEICLWQRSTIPTLTAALQAPEPSAIDEFIQACEVAGGAAEDWTRTIRLLCSECSEGSPIHEHHHDATPQWIPERQIGLAIEPDHAEALLERWTAAGDDRSYTDLEFALR